MKNKKLQIILWILSLILIWIIVFFYISKNWVKTIEFADWIKDVYTLKNWKKEWLEYIIYPNWIISFEHEYNNGFETSSTWYYRDWSLKEVTKFDNIWRENYKEKYNMDWIMVELYNFNGENIYYYDNWNVRWKGNRSESKKEWERTYYGENWNIISTCLYKESEPRNWICPNHTFYGDRINELLWFSEFDNWVIIK